MSNTTTIIFRPIDGAPDLPTAGTRMLISRGNLNTLHIAYWQPHPIDMSRKRWYMNGYSMHQLPDNMAPTHFALLPAFETE